MLYRLLTIWLLIALAMSAWYFMASTHADEPVQHPNQNQYRPSLEVPPGPLPRDRCISALLDDGLAEEMGYKKANWFPPLDDATAIWLETQRHTGRAKLFFCYVRRDT